jgi:adenine-specific DNA-methyltransferase
MSKVTSLKHTGDKRAHIPSKEEAGMENASDQVKKKEQAEYPVNPVVHRGQDPELFWLNKYGNDDQSEMVRVDIRSLYRYEHISPELLINNLYKIKGGQENQLDMFSLFGNTIRMDELEKVADYYQYSDDWKNRLIQGDSLLVMTSLLEREGMAGKVQTIYLDPPYGIKYGGNWQMKVNSKDMKEGNDEYLSGEPEMIKAFRDTWIDGVHSYLSYLRDRFIVAKELLTDSGSCFVQISDENIHLVRNVLDEVFGSENFVSLINFKKKKMTMGNTKHLEEIGDYLIYYAKNIEQLKFRPLFKPKDWRGDVHWSYLELNDGTRRTMTAKEKNNPDEIPDQSKVFIPLDLRPSGYFKTGDFPYEFNGKSYTPGAGKSWRTNKEGMDKLKELNRLYATATALTYVLYFDDYPVSRITNYWDDTEGAYNATYVVQTSNRIIERAILMSTDPGDLVLDPTCGSGTTAFLAEQWGRRWITIDTSRIALNIAKTRLMTAIFPYYELYDTISKDIRQGFVYKTVPHITLKSLANDEPAEEETLFDQPKEDKKKIRVSGTFTVETLQNFEPIPVGSLGNDIDAEEDIEHFESRIFEHLKSAGVKNGIKNENAVFKRVEHKSSAYLHAEGFYNDADEKEKKAYIHIGPKFGTVSKQAVNEAVKECRSIGDADWLIILGFSFEADIQNQNITTSVGSFEVTKVRMHDDLMQEGLLKKDKKAASFVTIGEPDIKANKDGKYVTIEIQGLDIYDPIMDVVKARSISDIAYWMVDDDYDSSNFIVKQVFFCGGDKDEFDKWKKGLNSVVKDVTKAKVQNTLRIEIDDEAFDKLYGFQSQPIEFKKGKKIAVRVISQFGEESMKVVTL